MSFSDQIRTFLDDDASQRLDFVFNLAFPLGGFLTSFVAMWLLHACRHSPHLYLGLVMCLANAFCVTSLLPSEASQLVGAVLFGPARTLQWASYFHFLASPERYPPHKVGRMMGYGNLVIAVFGDGPPYLLNAFIINAGWPATQSGRYAAVGVALAAPVVALSLALPLLLYRQELRRRRRARAGPLNGDLRRSSS